MLLIILFVNVFWRDTWMKYVYFVQVYSCICYLPLLAGTMPIIAP
jgi:hypothetical protein